MIFGREPALFFTLFAAVMQLAMALGMHLSPDQIAGIDAAMFAVVGFIVRQNVTPVV